MVNFGKFIEWWNNRTESISTTPQGKIDWGDVIQEIFDMTNSTVTGNNQTTIYPIRYSLQLVTILQSTDERTIVNYVQWNFLSKILPYTTNEILDLFPERLRKYSGGVEEKRPRWLECIEELKMDDAAAYLFIKKYYDGTSRETVHASEIVKNLRDSFKMHIRNSNSWSLEVKRAMENTLDRLTVHIGHPDWYNNSTIVTDYYRDLTIGNNYLENHLNFMKYKKALSLRPFTGAHENDRWDNSMLEINAYYNQDANSLTAPAIDFQSPLIAEQIPAYIKYGILGTMLGHEIGHTVSLADLQSGADSNNSFPNKMQKVHDPHVECFITKFNNYFNSSDKSQELPQNVSSSAEKSNLTEREKELLIGESTLEENLADATGVSVAFRAYKAPIDTKKPNEDLKLPGLLEYTDEQMFFISFAQTWCTTEKQSLDKENHHSPAKLRVLGVIPNSIAFTESFHCPNNTPMNPEAKCDLWT